MVIVRGKLPNGALVNVNEDKKKEVKELVELVRSPIRKVFGAVEVNSF